LHQIPKLSRPYIHFQEFPGPKKLKKFFKDFQGSVATLITLNYTWDYTIAEMLYKH